MKRAIFGVILVLMMVGGTGWLVFISQETPAPLSTPIVPFASPVLSKSPAATSHPSLTRPYATTQNHVQSIPTNNPAVTRPSSKPNPVAIQSLPKPVPVERKAAVIKVIRGQVGFWRLAQDSEGIWWFLSPEGRLEFLNGVTTVQPYQLPRDKFGPHYISKDWDISSTNTDAALDLWARRTIDRVHSLGFKAIAAWSHPALHQLNIPMTRDLNCSAYVDPAMRRFYYPHWAESVEAGIRKQVESLKDNRNLIGYFLDNELDWSDSGAGPGAYFDFLTPDDPNRQQVLRVIRSLWATTELFNAEWKTTLGDFKQLDSWRSIPREPSRAYNTLAAAFRSRLAEDYFRTLTALVRKYDPNHLLLGIRYKGYAVPEVVRASRNYTDAQSINYYVSDAQLDLDLFRMIYEQSQQPILLSEYSFHALDGRSGNRNTIGFYAQVLDQQARADGYRLFTSRLARVPYIVGADWFQWCDESPSGRQSDGEDANFGVVDIDDRPYSLLVDAIRKTSSQLNSLHAKCKETEQTDVWRESFASRPIMHVPFMDHPPQINGELSDWPPQCKLQGMRHSQTVGLERSQIPLPNMYLGWTEEGLYVGMEIFDNDIQGAPAKGAWWSRDCAELWISTRPTPADQNAYDVYCHQFFFVPIEFPDNDGSTGIVGQWHRSGDALTDHLIPHPAIRQASRILPDRYVVEMFIPAIALNGFNPRNQPAISFNANVRNFQHAIEYFWSAPKEVLTQLRPGTWGTLQLDPPATVSAMNWKLPTTRPAN